MTAAKRGHHQRATTVRSLILFVQLILILMPYFLRLYFDSVPASRMIYPLSLLLTVICIWTGVSWWVFMKRFFDPYMLFFLSASLFNAGHAFLEVFSLNRRGLLNSQFSSDTVVDALYLVMIGLSALHFGTLIAAGRRDAAQHFDDSMIGPPFDATRAMRAVGWALLVIAAIPTLLQLTQAVRIFMALGYGALYERQIGTGFGATPGILSSFFVPGSLFLLAGSKGKKFNIMVSAGALVMYAAISLVLGYRGDFAMTMIAFAWLWHRRFKPLPLVSLLTVGVGISFVVFPLIYMLRAFAGSQWMSLDFITYTWRSIENPVVMSISEFGFSLQTVAYTLELVPKWQDFNRGLDYLSALTLVFPNLFWSVHPAALRRTPAFWLVWTVRPALAARGGGLGFSFIAEAYLNFGWVGTPIVVAVIGFLFAKLVFWADQDDQPARLALLASFLSFFLIYPRGDFATVVRPLIWFSFLPYLAVMALRRWSRMPDRKHLATRESRRLPRYPLLKNKA